MSNAWYVDKKHMCIIGLPFWSLFYSCCARAGYWRETSLLPTTTKNCKTCQHTNKYIPRQSLTTL